MRDLIFQQRGLTEFSVQGNLHIREYQLDIDVWEIFTPERWKSRGVMDH